MILTTTPSVEGYQIAEYLGIVAGEATMDADIACDLMAGITDMIGGRSASYELKLAEARPTALAEMQAQAAKRGASAMVGVNLEYEVIGLMLVVSASGTAVRNG